MASAAPVGAVAIAVSLGAFTDLAIDQPASPASTFTYTVNLTQCLAARGLTFEPGELQGFAFGGTSSGDSAFQTINFKRQ